METARFDALISAWFGQASRRRALAGLLVGTSGGLGLRHVDDAGAAKSGRCKRPCGQCQFCDKGTCKKQNGKKRCKKGTCQPLARGTPCGENCVCGRSIEGDGFCAANILIECSANCIASAQCPAGRRCIRCLGSESTACAPECGVV